MRNHTTTATNWHLDAPPHEVPAFKKELATLIDGCPYEINMEIVLGVADLEEMGFHPDDREEHIVYTLQMHPPEREVQVNFKLWDYITAVNLVMDLNDTSGWTLHEWDNACPFLFDDVPNLALPDEEALQRERDLWK